MRALMIYFIRSGCSFDDFKAIINNPITATCYQQEIENEKNKNSGRYSLYLIANNQL